MTRGGKNMEQLSDEELDHGAEEDSDKEDQDLDKMFGAWLGELDKLTQSLDTDKPVAPVKRSPLHQETNLANFSYRFSMYNLNEALNQGETVDLDALMADLCSIEQELSSIGSHSANNTAVKRLATETKAQKPPASRPSTKHSSMKGLSSSSGKVTKPSHANVSLDDITAQLEKASLSMDEAAQQSVEEDTKPVVTAQHRRTASAGTVSDAEVRSISNSSRSSITSAASSMDSLDIDKSSNLTNASLFGQEEQAAKLKAEKIRVALEKIKEAQVKKNYLLGKKETSEMADRNKEVLLELDHVNVYYGQDYRNKYKAPTDYCLVLKHPQIQKKSQYIKYLCCDDVRTLHQWINGIRIAKYGKQLYMNYQEALKRTESAYDWTSLSSSSIKSGSSSSSLPESQSNHSNQSDSGVSDTQPTGHVRSQSIVSSMFSEAWKRGTQLEESSKARMEPAGRPFMSVAPPVSPQTKVAAPYAASQPSPPLPPPPPPPPPPVPAPPPPQAPPKPLMTALPPQPSGKAASPGVTHVTPPVPVPLPLAIKKQPSVTSSQVPPLPPAPPGPTPPPTFPKQQSFSVKPPPSPQSPVPSVVKQIASHFPPPPTPPAAEPQPLKPLPLSVAPQSPPAVKAKPKWQPASVPSPDFPPPPPESSLVFPPPPPSPATSAGSPPPDKSGSPVKKTSKISSPGGKKPPPTPQRNSSIKSTSSTEYHESKRPSVDRLVSKFAHPPEPSGSPSKESLPPAAPPKPGKLNLSGVSLPIVVPHGGIPAKAPVPGVSGKEPVVEFPSPPSDSDFPPPPPEIDLPVPPVEIPSVFSGSTSPKVAVVNPQPQAWSKPSIKKAPPPTRPKRNDSTRLTQADVAEPPVTPGPQVPTSPKSSLSVQPGFLADLNRTLQRKSITRHGSLSSARMSRAEPTATMDDMALPPPPPELLADQQKTSSFKGSHISGYATLRRGPPPAPPKRDQNTKLSQDW
ncbi:Ras-associated and pleckstrin-like proteiny domains-containing protein 1 [Aix galericulata]|nr:Ras-associated and pleckstrin-like proteiny domains-containing protein 1 [Aix galericulata]